MKRAASIFGSALLVLGFSTLPAAANWVASGTFQYVDREQDQNGFTGAQPVRPVRLADIEVVDANKTGRKAILAQGATTLSGSFSITVSDSSVRSVYVRVITRSNITSSLHIDIRQNTGSTPIYYASSTATIPGHSPNVNVNFGTLVIPIGAGGEAFNLYDQLLRGCDYVASLAGSRPDASRHVTAVWGLNNGVANSFYDVAASRVVLRDTAGYDDTVVLHEMGHHIIRKYSATSTPGGANTFSLCNLDIRLSFDEGWATYFGNSTLRFAGFPRSNIYTRTTGAPGPGNLVRYADLETDTQYLCEGATSELVVTSIMWDIVDGASTPDTTPGVEDAHDTLDVADSEMWQVMTSGIPGDLNISLEDFWDSWFLSPVSNGFRPQMIDIAAHHGVEYFEDTREVNDTAAQATSAPTDGSTTHSSLFRDSNLDGAGAEDFDWFYFGASAGQSYAIETLNLRSDGNTSLRLYDTNGTTVLVLNDDRAPGDDSSLIEWVAPRTDQFFARVHHGADVGIYGSYDLKISAQNPSDDDLDGYDTTTDCNDTDPNINPGAAEICDGIDQDCDTVVDDGFDLDGDGYTTCAGDCDDADPNANPGLPEIPSNGVDDNCNGQTDEQPQTDTVTITSATYKSGPKKLTVYATSSQQPGVTLTVVGFGVMTWDVGPQRYFYVSPNNTPNPGTVTVQSSGGGSATAVVQ